MIEESPEFSLYPLGHEEMIVSSGHEDMIVSSERGQTEMSRY